MTDATKLADETKPMDEAALIEELARVIRDTSFCGFSESDGSRSYCSRDSADPKSCQCFDGARAILPIIRRLLNHTRKIAKFNNLLSEPTKTE